MPHPTLRYLFLLGSLGSLVSGVSGCTDDVTIDDGLGDESPLGPDDSKADVWVPRSDRGRVARAEIASYNGSRFDAYVVCNPSTGEWVYSQWDGERSFGTTRVRLGGAYDRCVLGDYDDDGRTDPAVWRASTGEWIYISSLRRREETMDRRFGGPGDVPVPGDYDGDQKTDLAVYRPSTRTYWYFSSRDNRDVSFTAPTDGTPVPADYDGDGKTDAAIWSAGNWWIRNSNGGSITTYRGYGYTGDTPMAGMYDNDNKADPAIFNTLGWWSILSSTNRYAVEQASHWGYGTTDIPTVGDHDNTDGHELDFVVYRPNDRTFYALGLDGNLNPPPRMRTTMPAGSWQPVAGPWRWRPPLQL